ncbi:MAG: cysteine--tRNA ligase [Calditrichaeota bacterium]|nr:MAG: cysteine--tRNA ligase [Calditrichota bacterium]
MLKIFNTLTKKKEEFIPVEEGKAKIYVCGPTVYNFFHIGNARPFITYDIVRKYLEFLGYDVTYVMNLTDIDDKIINRAIEEKISTEEVAEKYTAEFFKDIDELRIKRADVYPKATDHIKEMIQMVETLIEKGFAYESKGDVYFNIPQNKEYGKLSGKILEELQASERTATGSGKKNDLDFTLWKSAKPNEPAWESPWGKGRPGWHLECSAMSTKYLGETFDIHGGGTDLVFPHHENEIAQSECTFGKQFVNYWMHNGMLNLNDEKMSKSLGNFFTTREVLGKFLGESVRMLMIQKHYRSPIAYSFERLEEAQSSVERITSTYKRGLEKLNGNLEGGDEVFAQRIEQFKEGMNDDFNTAKGMSIVFEAVKEVNILLSKLNLNETEKNILVGEIKFIEKTDKIFDVILKKEEEGGGKFGEVMKILIKLRKKLRAKKDWELSDYLRDELEKINILIQDTPNGTKWDIKK